MRVLLPPSETKASGGDGPPLALDGLSYPELTPARRKLVDELVALSGDAAAGLAALGLSERQSGELKRDVGVWSAPTLPALAHHNKSHKGRLARLLATAPREASDGAGVARIAQRGRLPAIRTGEHTVELVVPT